MSTPLPPLILGADGRLGRAFRNLWEGGHMGEAPRPIWHARGPGLDVAWDMAAPAPALPPVRGVICLAGRTSGTEAELEANTTAALAALDLARERRLGPVLLMSSAAVYGAGPGPHDEDGPPTRPAGAYGAAKLAMEQAAAGRGCCLRLANVAGCDALFGAMARGPVTLDRFADGNAPARAYIGPLTLARTLLALLNLSEPPPVLNVAQPGTLSMDAVLTAAGHPFTWRPAPKTALPEMALATDRIEAAISLPPVSAPDLVAEARAAGWRPGP